MFDELPEMLGWTFQLQADDSPTFVLFVHLPFYKFCFSNLFFSFFSLDYLLGHYLLFHPEARLVSTPIWRAQKESSGAGLSDQTIGIVLFYTINSWNSMHIYSKRKTERKKKGEKKKDEEKNKKGKISLEGLEPTTFVTLTWFSIQKTFYTDSKL